MITEKNTLVIIPALNEERSIGRVIDEIKANGIRNVLVVDDGSVDQTALISSTHGAKVISHVFNLGVGGAIQTGMKFALQNGFTAVVQVDADGQHDVSGIATLIEAANESSADMILGSRFLADSLQMRVGTSRRIAMRFLAALASRSCQVTITDSTSGFRLIQGQLIKEMAKGMPTNYLGDTFEVLLAAGRAGYKIREIPTTMSDRIFGASSAGRLFAFAFTLKAILVLLTHTHYRFNSPIHND